MSCMNSTKTSLCCIKTKICDTKWVMSHGSNQRTGNPQKSISGHISRFHEPQTAFFGWHKWAPVRPKIAGLCHSPWHYYHKNKVVAEYALRGMTKAIGVSEYQLTRALPREFRSSLPSIEEIEAELEGAKEHEPRKTRKVRKRKSNE